MRLKLAVSVLAVIVVTAAIGTGHTVFSAAPQVGEGGFTYFTMLEEPAPLPDVPVTDAAGDATVLADRDGLLLVNIWATWCAPCVKEMPALDALQAALGGDRFEVVAVSTDFGGMDAVRPFFDKLGIAHLTPYLDPKSAFARAMEATGLPVTYLVKDGAVIGRAVGPEEWDSPAAKALIRSHL